MLLYKNYVRPVEVLMKPSLISLRRFLFGGIKMRHRNTVPLLVWLSKIEYYLSQIWIVASPGELPTFLFFVLGEFYYLLSICLEFHFL